MTTSLVSGLDTAIDGHRLLEHPFYRRWTAGTLGAGELRAYAAQYRYIERSQPRWLAGVVDGLEGATAREAVNRVLADETEPAATHADLFEQFAAAVGAAQEEPATAATTALLATIDGLVTDGPIPGLGALLAYELQSAAISEEKADGLRRHFGVDGEGAVFWEVHAALDRRHSGWLVEALAACDDPAAEAWGATRAAAAAWWAFLDEREATAATA